MAPQLEQGRVQEVEPLGVAALHEYPPLRNPSSPLTFPAGKGYWYPVHTGTQYVVGTLRPEN